MCGRYVCWYTRHRKNSPKLLRVIFCIVWDYFPFWHARNRPKSIARYVWWYIRTRKNFKKLFRAVWSILRDYFRLLYFRNRSKTCGRYLWWHTRHRKNSLKIFRAGWSRFWETIFDYSTSENIQIITDYIAK